MPAESTGSKPGEHVKVAGKIPTPPAPTPSHYTPPDAPPPLKERGRLVFLEHAKAQMAAYEKSLWLQKGAESRGQTENAKSYGDMAAIALELERRFRIGASAE